MSKFKAYKDNDDLLNIVSPGYGYLEIFSKTVDDDIVFIPLGPKEEYNTNEMTEVPLAEAFEHFRIRADKNLFYRDHDEARAKVLFVEIREEVNNIKKIPTSYEIKERTLFEVYKDGNLLTVTDSKEDAEGYALNHATSDKIARVSKRTKLSEKTVARVLADLENNEA